EPPARQERLLAMLQKALGHELPNRLIAVRGLAALLELEDGARLGAEGREYLARLAAEADRAHALVFALAEAVRWQRPAAPPQAAERLFEPFSGEDGPGLDLFLVRQLAEGWGGTARVEAGPGRGVAFVVTCPLAV